MQTKSSRGVQQSEVWAAADTLLADGVRPTIERVRQKLGRGSPNTVAPMLESWFATLGPRLGLAAGDDEGRTQGLPLSVQQAFQSIWSTALATAELQAQEDIAAQRQALDIERQSLQRAREDLDRQLEAAKLHETTLQQALSATQRHLEETAAKASQLETAVHQGEQELATTRRSLSELVQERNEDRRRQDEQLAAIAQDQRRQLDLSTETERRHLQEIDRLRQSLKKALQDNVVQESRHEEALKRIEQANHALGIKFRDAELEIAGLRERATASQARADDLQHLIEQGLASAPQGKQKRSATRKKASGRHTAES